MEATQNESGAGVLCKPGFVKEKCPAETGLRGCLAVTYPIDLNNDILDSGQGGDDAEAVSAAARPWRRSCAAPAAD
jgi:hypothetical protein